MLTSIYSHLDATTTIAAATSAQTAASGASEADPVGKPRRGGGSSVFVTDVGHGHRKVTIVIWADADRLARGAPGR